MEYGTIEGVAKPVSRLILGTMAYQPEPPDRYEHWSGMLDAFVAAGGTAFDTANIYQGGRSEQALGKWLQERGNREQVVIVGKGAHPKGGNPRRVNPEAIDADIAESLERLRTPYIDLYLLHRDDVEVPVGPIVECLNRHIDAGRLRAIGGSNWTSARLDEANAYATAHGMRPFTASSPNLALAHALEPMWPGCVNVDASEIAWYRERQFPLLSWSSQARGFFSGRFAPDVQDNADIVRVYYADENWERLRRARALAERKGTTPTRIALAWVLRQPLPTFPLIGPLTREELADSLAALDVPLSAEEAAWLNLESAAASAASARREQEPLPVRRPTILTLIPDANYRSMITEETDARLDALGSVRRARGDRAAIAAQAPALLREASVLLTGWGTPALQPEWLASAPNLRFIGHCAGSVRGIVPPAVFERGVTLCHAAPIIADAVAEFCVAVELQWLRRAPERDAQLKAGVPWSEVKTLALEGRLLAAQRVGLVGSGYVAQRHIRLLHAFGAAVRVADPYLTAERAAELGVARASMEEVFGECDIIAVHAPKTPATHHLIGADLLRRIRPGAILVQNSRSWVMDQEALLAELQTGRFFAALDVFDQEPQPADSQFFRLPNVIVTPHMAGATRESYAQQGRAIAEDLARFLAGQPLQYAIAPDRYDQMA